MFSISQHIPTWPAPFLCEGQVFYGEEAILQAPLRLAVMGFHGNWCPVKMRSGHVDYCPSCKCNLCFNVLCYLLYDFVLMIPIYFVILCIWCDLEWTPAELSPPDENQENAVITRPVQRGELQLTAPEKALGLLVLGLLDDWAIDFWKTAM